MTLGQGHDTPLDHGNDCLKYYPDPTRHSWRQRGIIAWTWILGICALWPWPWRDDLSSRSWHTFGSWTTIVWNIIQIQHGSEELLPGHWFWVPVFLHFDLWPWFKVRTYPWFMDNNFVKYYQDLTWQWGVMSQTRTLRMCSPRPWPWVMDNNCVIYYPDRTRGEKL